MKIIFDFDDTVFDTKKFKEEVLFKIFEKIDKSVDSRVVAKEYSKYRKDEQVFSMDVFLENIIKKYKLTDLVKLKDLYTTLEIGIKKCLIPDYEKIIRLFGKKNIVILTHGEEKFQKFKIELSGITGLVDDVVVVKDSKKDYIIGYCKTNKGHKVYFVDDKIENFLLNDLPKNLVQVLVNTGKPANIEKYKEKIFVVKKPLDLTRVFVVKQIKDRSERRGLV
jgi:hypothetical protein